MRLTVMKPIWKEKTKKKKKDTLEKDLDKVWSELVKIRAGYKCELCGVKNKKLNSHHFVGRINRNLRWDLRNGMSLCTQHHRNAKQSAHNDPEWFREKVLVSGRAEDYLYVNKVKGILGLLTRNEKVDLLKRLKNLVNTT